MMLTRFLVCAVIASGMAFAAGQSTLPTPMSSAIDRLVDPTKQTAPAKPVFNFDPQKTMILPLPPAEVRFGLKACSIPLAESKIPDKPKFFIRQAPVPKDSPDRMPVLEAPVCPPVEAR